MATGSISSSSVPRSNSSPLVLIVADTMASPFVIGSSARSEKSPSGSPSMRKAPALSVNVESRKAPEAVTGTFGAPTVPPAPSGFHEDAENATGIGQLNDGVVGGAIHRDVAGSAASQRRPPLP